MIKNIIFDIGSVMVTELGAKAFPYLNKDEQNELDQIVYSRENGFAEVLLGQQTTEEYRDCLF